MSVERSAPRGAVFLSYASQDAAAAARLCAALRAAGVEVWFDQSELVGGDAWDAKIRKQIADCVLFVPVISAATQARTEGYFRLEWKLAAQRTHMIADDAAFLLPVVIDATRDAEARVPPEFKSVQWTRFTGGETPVAFCERVNQLLGGAEVGSPVGGALSPDSRHQTAGSGRKAPPTAGNRGAWLWPAIAGALALVTLAVWRPWDGSTAQPVSAAGAPGGAEKTTAPVSEARKLTLQARALIDDDPLAVRQNYLLAEELCKKAVALDVSDAEAWATYARVSLAFWDWGYDDTPRRWEAARSQSQRAIRLAPDSIEAGLAEAWLTFVSRPPKESGDEPEPRLRALLRQAPGDKRVYRLLANTLSRVGRSEEASALRLQSAALPGGDPQALSDDASPFTGSVFNPWVSDRMFDRVFATTPTKTAYHARLVTRIHSLGDLEAARTFLATIPEQLMTEDLFAAQAFILWLRLGEPEKALAAIKKVPRDFLEERRQKYPRATLEGLAHALAGRSAAATVKWTEALRLVEQRLGTESNQPVWLFNQALTLALLGKKEAAKERLEAFRQLGAFAEFLGAEGGAPVVLLLLGDTEAAIGGFQRQMGRGQRSQPLVLSALRFDPLLKPIRDDPRVQAMIREGLAQLESLRLAAGNAARSSAAAPPPSASGQKSVAVLAFTNLSDDKANEYFSDGISEELLNVLAKVPGLKVSARTSAFHFKGKNAPIPDIAKQLGVAYVVEGSVRKAGNQVRITAQLIKAADGFHVWSDTFTRDLKDIFAVQDEIAGLIAEKLSLKLGQAGPSGKSIDPDAHRLLLEGRHYWNLRTPDDFVRAERAFDAALKLAPDLAEAHAGLADVSVVRGWYRLYDGEAGFEADFARAKAEAQEAIRLDGALAGPVAALAAVLMNEGDLPGAEQHFQRALALNPNHATARFWYSILHMARGDLDLALTEVEHAVRLDPLSFIILDDYARDLAYARRLSEAEEVGNRAQSVRREFFVPNHAQRAIVLWQLGRTDAALAVARAVRQSSATPRWWSDSEAIFVLYEAGAKLEAAAYADEVLARLPPRSYVRGFVLASVGRFDDAMPYLEQTPLTVQRRLIWAAMWDRWRNDPGFARLIARLGRTAEYQRGRAVLERPPANAPRVR